MMTGLFALLPVLLAALKLAASQGDESPSVTGQELFRRVVDLLVPGEDILTETAVTSLLSVLENRVQCSEVPCEKVKAKLSDHCVLGTNSTADCWCHLKATQSTHFAIWLVLN